LFAPDSEIQLCGHGAMAALAFLKKHHGITETKLFFNGGVLDSVLTDDETVSFTSNGIPTTKKIDTIDPNILAGLGIELEAAYKTNNKQLLIAKNKTDVKHIKPNYEKLRKCDWFGYAVTAKGTETDFVSRTFVPHVGQLEDPATGSSHLALALYWSKQLKKSNLTALQLSERGGYFKCDVKGDKVQLTSYYQDLGSFSL